MWWPFKKKRASVSVKQPEPIKPKVDDDIVTLVAGMIELFPYSPVRTSPYSFTLTYQDQTYQLILRVHYGQWYATQMVKASNCDCWIARCEWYGSSLQEVVKPVLPSLKSAVLA